MGKVIEYLDFAFDVSTSKTGWAALIGGKPFTLGGEPSYGFIPMVKTEEYEGFEYIKGIRVKVKKSRPIKYGNYGNKMFHGSYQSMLELSSKVYDTLTRLHDKDIKINKVNIILEVSEIPNYGKNGGQALTSVRMLALYSGGLLMFLSHHLRQLINFHDMSFNVKLVSPTEWQLKAKFTKSNFTKEGEIKEFGMPWSKFQSLRRANAMLKNWNYPTITNDDTADAINIVTLASQLRDGLFVRGSNNARETKIRDYEVKKSKLVSMRAKLLSKASEKKQAHLERVLSSKQSKYSYEEEKSKNPLKMLNKAEWDSYEKSNMEINRLDELISKKKKRY